MTRIYHKPVLLQEVLKFLHPEPNNIFVDATVGQGGHAQALLEAALPVVRLLAIDRDQSNLAITKERLKKYENKVEYVCDSYANLKSHAYDLNFNSVNGILLDIGFSSIHVDDPARGFSFQSAGPLDMRYNQQQELTAEKIISEWDEDDLAEIFRKYGEEKHARKIAQAILKARKDKKISTTTQLADLISSVMPRRGKTHPATKVFQALRIAVNDELGQLEQVLPDAVDLLAPGGRLAIISFHSLEDRIVKNFLKSHPSLKVITKKPVTASAEELKDNPRARSAKLRVAEKI